MSADCASPNPAVSNSNKKAMTTIGLHPKAGSVRRPSINMPLAFEQQPKESAKAFAAFQTYLGMGPQRSLDAVSQKCAKSLPLLKRWSARWEWTLRVAAQAAQVAAVERLAVAVVARAKAVDWAQRETALRETEWAMHERAIGAAKRGLDEYLKRDKVYANLADIARMLEIASKLGRLATGLGTDGERRADVGLVRVEVRVALDKIYGAPLAGEVVEVQSWAAVGETLAALPGGEKP